MNKHSVDDQRVRRVLSRVLRTARQVQRTNPVVVRRTRPLTARRVASAPVGALVRYAWVAQVQSPSRQVASDQRVIAEELSRRGLSASAREVQRWSQEAWRTREAAEDSQDAAAQARSAVRSARRDAAAGVDGALAVGMVAVAAAEAAVTAEELEQQVALAGSGSSTTSGQVTQGPVAQVMAEQSAQWEVVDEAADALEFAEQAYPEGVGVAVVAEMAMSDGQDASEQDSGLVVDEVDAAVAEP